MIPTPALDPAPDVTWALSRVAEARVRRAQGIVDEHPLDEPLSLIAAIEHRGEIRAAAERTAGWRQAA